MGDALKCLKCYIENLKKVQSCNRLELSITVKHRKVQIHCMIHCCLYMGIVLFLYKDACSQI